MCSVKSDLTREKLDDDKNKSQQSECSVMEIRCTFFLFLFASLSQSLSTSHRQFYSKPSTIKQRRFQLLCGKRLNPEAIDWKRHFSWAFIALSAVMKLVYCDFIAGYFGGGRVWCKNLEKFPANISKFYFFYSLAQNASRAIENFHILSDSFCDILKSDFFKVFSWCSKNSRSRSVSRVTKNQFF